MIFTYHRSLAERLEAGELRDVSAEAKAGGFRWPLAATRQLAEAVEQVPPTRQREETARGRWQHIFLLVAPAAAQMERESSTEKEINVVLRTSGAADRSREHVKTLLLCRERGGDTPDQFTLGLKGE